MRAPQKRSPTVEALLVDDLLFEAVFEDPEQADKDEFNEIKVSLRAAKRQRRAGHDQFKAPQERVAKKKRSGG